MALSFTAASSQYLTIGTALPSANGPSTFSCWLYLPSGTPSTTQGLIYSGDSAFFAQQSLVWGASMFAIICDDGLGNYQQAVTPSSYPPGAWYHVAGTYSQSGSSATINCYVNGVNEATFTGTQVAHTTPNLTRIGFWNTAGVTYTCQGSLAEVAIWNTVLNASEVAALATGINARYVRPNALMYPASGGYWPLWGLASPEPDMSGNVNNMTLVNAPVYAPHAPVTLWTPRRPLYLIPPAIDTPGSNLIRVHSAGWRW